jgi:hypothetical protein
MGPVLPVVSWLPVPSGRFGGSVLSVRSWLVLTLAAVVLASTAAAAHADVPVGPARYVPCPPPTGDISRYTGPSAPYICHSAVVDPLGNVVILRRGQSYASTPSAFGMLHTLFDHNVEDHVVESVVSSAFPRTAPQQRVRFSAEFRAAGGGVMQVWVDVDRHASDKAPDTLPFGVLTAYCKLPSNAGPENKCPDWVNDTL